MDFYDTNAFKTQSHKGAAPLISLRTIRQSKGDRDLRTLLDPPHATPPHLLRESSATQPPLQEALRETPLSTPPHISITPPPQDSNIQTKISGFSFKEGKTATQGTSPCPSVPKSVVPLLNADSSSPAAPMDAEPPCPFGRHSSDARDPYDWRAWARPEQNEPEGKWRLWLILAGRGFGKTRTGAECIRAWVESNRYKRIGLIGATDDDIRHVMVEGCSGILSTYPPQDAPKYEPSKRQITWPNGAIAQLVSAERFDKLRGRQFDAVWVDELAKFRYAQETWDQLALSLRLGDHPKMIVTTTPRPTALIKRLSTPNTWSVITRGSSYANKDNLAPGFIEHIQESCKNEKLLRQEIEGEIVDDVAGALWQREILDHQRITADQLPEMQRVVVAVDPSVAHHDEGDETGIVVAGLGVDHKGYVLADFSGRYGTPGWAEQVLNAYTAFKADCIIAEENQGGALVEQVLRTIDPDVFYQKVHAARGKLARAEPVAALYARGRIHHVGTDLHHLERQLCTYVPGVSAQSPDRLDALVWAISALMLNRLRPKKTRLWTMEKSLLLPESVPSPPNVTPHLGRALQ